MRGFRLLPATDLPKARLESHLVQAFKWQAEKQADAVTQGVKGPQEGLTLPRLFDGGRIFDAPMGGHRMARPDWTGLACRIVTDREDEIELGRAGRRELVPAL